MDSCGFPCQLAASAYDQVKTTPVAITTVFCPVVHAAASGLEPRICVCVLTSRLGVIVELNSAAEANRCAKVSDGWTENLPAPPVLLHPQLRVLANGEGIDELSETQC